MKNNYFKRLWAFLRPWFVSLFYGERFCEKIVGSDLKNFGRLRKILFVSLMILTALLILPAVALSMAGVKKKRIERKDSAENF
jgi:hypothetical protein